MSRDPLSILIVEDDGDALANLRVILELDRHQVATASTAAQALERSEEEWPAFSAIILDRLLPDSNCDDLLPKLRKVAPTADVIVVTGRQDIEGAIEALRLGAADSLLKPISPEMLRASLSRIADRRGLTLAKERSDAAFRNLIDAAQCMIMLFRSDRTVAYVNPHAEALTGYRAGEVVGHHAISFFFDPPQYPATSRVLDRALAGETIDGYENQLRCRDGSHRELLWNCRMLTDFEGGPALLVVGHDITAIKEAQRRALQAERLAAIGQMVAGLAHESRNALQRSQACLEMLALAVKDRPAALDLIHRLQHAQDHLHHLYEDVRGYAAPITLDTRPSDLAEIWRETWSNLMETRPGARATLHEVLAATDTLCRVDSFRMGQAFRNVLENSLAAGDGNVQVEVRADDTEMAGQPAIRLAFRDNGPGIPPRDRREVFEPFFTTRARGTGLGMAITRRVVEAHGGNIQVADEGPPGTAFLITLPRGL